MHPELVHITLHGHNYTVMSYTTLLVSALIMYITVGTAVARSRGLKPKSALVFYISTVIILCIFARVMHWVFSETSFPEGMSQVLSFSRTNLSGYAGLLVALVTAAAIFSRSHYPIWNLLDASVPALTISAICAKCGCLLNGCCFGITTNMPWGVTPPPSLADFNQVIMGDIGFFAKPLPVHPIQIYEMIIALISGVTAVTVYRCRRTDGLSILTFMTLFSLGRWLIYPLSQSSRYDDIPAWAYPSLYASVIIVCSILVFMRIKSAAKNANLPNKLI